LRRSTATTGQVDRRVGFFRARRWWNERRYPAIGEATGGRRRATTGTLHSERCQVKIEVDWQDGRPGDGATFERLVSEAFESMTRSGHTFRGLVTVAIVRTAGRAGNPNTFGSESGANWRCNGVTDDRGEIDDGEVLEAVDDALLVFMNS
jgi:hypothetical protein